MSKAKDLRDQPEESLQEKLQTLLKEIYEFRGQQLDAKSQKTHVIGQKKKEIARIKTILKERELAQ